MIPGTMKTTVTILMVFVFTLGAFSQVPGSWEGKVMTVNGLIPADSMGITLPHEHLLIVHKYNYLDLTDEADAITELGYFVNAGGKTVTEVTNIGIGRNPEGLKRISTATGTNIIMGAGFYKDKWIPDSIKNKSVELLTEIIISDIINGISGIHSGVIGEIGISRPITQFEEKVLIAAARAQKATGAAIDVHFDINGPISERHYALDILENEGADLTRVYISHNTTYDELVDDYITLAQRGCYVAFDLLGMEIYGALAPHWPDPLEPAETIKGLIDEGYLNNILVSQDVAFTTLLVKNGGYGYAHILKTLVPKFKAGGITDEQINTIMVENPKRILPFKNYTDVGQCVNATYVTNSGTVSDNSGTSDYLNNMSCSKLIQPSNCSSVTLTFSAFDTETGNDVLSIYDGATTSSPLLGQYSGTTLPPVLTSTGGSMLIVFTTNGSITASGWNTSYYGTLNIDYTGPCVNETFTAMTGTITDNSGSTNYNNNMSCHKLVQPSGAVNVTLTFNSFATESGYDFVKVYDGATTSSPLLGQYSGTSLPAAVSSTGASMLIVFTTDNSVVAEGWSATYTGNAPALSVTPESRSISSALGTTSFTVTSNINWSVSESSSWLTATKTDATTLTVSYDENTRVDPRSAEITVSGTGVTSQNIMVNQSGASPALSVTPESRPVSSAPGTTTFTVTSNIDWSVSESTGWLTATKTDTTTLTISYDENTSIDPRSAEITVSGAGVTSKSIMVNQSGASPALSIAPESQSISSVSGSTTFTVASNVDWSVSESTSWLEAIKTDITTLTVNYEENIVLDSRSAEITVSGAGVNSQSVSITQEGAIPSTIKSKSDIKQINVFPNPVSNKTGLTYPKGTKVLIEIYEPSGGLIIRLQDSDKNGETEIDFSGLNSGLYIYRLIDKEGNIYNGKILKE